MMVLPFGMAMPNEVSVNEQPTPKITSASARNFGTARGTARPPEPSDSGCVSGNDETLRQPFELGPGLGVMHALAGINHRPLGADQQCCGFLHVHGVRAVTG